MAQPQGEPSLLMQIGVENMDSNSVVNEIYKQYWTGQMNRREALQALEVRLNLLPLSTRKTIFENGGIIAGGIWADTLIGRVHKDVDVYFPSQEAVTKAFKDLYILTPKPSRANLRVGQFEFMRFIYFPSATEVIESFDLSCVQIAYDGALWHFGEHTLEDISNRYLRLQQVNCPLAVQTKRLTKYMEKGFVPDEHTFGVICKHIKQGGDQVKTMYEEYPKGDINPINPDPQPQVAGIDWVANPFVNAVRAEGHVVHNQFGIRL